MTLKYKMMDKATSKDKFLSTLEQQGSTAVSVADPCFVPLEAKQV